MRIIHLDLVTRLQDNGDGGYTAFFYNTAEELLADHPNTTDWDPELKDYVKKELTEEEKREILEEDDPYTNGYIGLDKMTLNLHDDGTVTLAEPFSVGLGQ